MQQSLHGCLHIEPKNKRTSLYAPYIYWMNFPISSWCENCGNVWWLHNFLRALKLQLPRTASTSNDMMPFSLHGSYKKKKEFFPVHQIFPSKGIWCAASADTCQGIKPKSRFGWRGNLKKIFSKTHLTSSLAYLIALQEHNYNVWHMLNNKLPIPESIVFCAFCNIWLIVPPTSVGCWLIVLSHSSEFSSKKKHTT